MSFSIITLFLCPGTILNKLSIFFLHIQIVSIQDIFFLPAWSLSVLYSNLPASFQSIITYVIKELIIFIYTFYKKWKKLSIYFSKNNNNRKSKKKKKKLKWDVTENIINNKKIKKQNEKKKKK